MKKNRKIKKITDKCNLKLSNWVIMVEDKK
jgi:hypothetical protein